MVRQDPSYGCGYDDKEARGMSYYGMVHRRDGDSAPLRVGEEDIEEGNHDDPPSYTNQPRHHPHYSPIEEGEGESQQAHLLGTGRYHRVVLFPLGLGEGHPVGEGGVGGQLQELTG